MARRRRLAWFVVVLALMPVACGKRSPEPDRLVLERQSFADLPGWDLDDFSGAIPALLKSCQAIALAKPDPLAVLDVAPADFTGPCSAAAGVPAGDGAAAKSFFERYFVPFQASNHAERDGLFTGYYEAELHGATSPDARFATPLYRRPADLVQVDLGRFRPSLAGDRIAGKVVGGKLEPYATRAEIESGALAGKGLELLWVDDAVDAFFLAIQGSGRVILPDGQIVRLGYDGENGQPYVAIGRVLAERGVPKDEITMPYLRRWIAQHGQDGASLMDANPSYIFFKVLHGDGPLGAEGIALTPERSAAIDRRFVAFGLPLWVDAADPVERTGRLQRLFVAQDTGGAIRGPVRADLFFGYGEAAAQHAGVLKGQGGIWVLLPAAAAARQGRDP
jgi:membrane-bound lytic murein transglycosylase A